MESKERQNYYLRTVCFHSQLMLEGGIVKKNTEKDYFSDIPTIITLNVSYKSPTGAFAK